MRASAAAADGGEEPKPSVRDEVFFFFITVIQPSKKKISPPAPQTPSSMTLRSFAISQSPYLQHVLAPFPRSTFQLPPLKKTSPFQNLNREYYGTGISPIQHSLQGGNIWDAHEEIVKR